MDGNAQQIARLFTQNCPAVDKLSLLPVVKEQIKGFRLAKYRVLIITGPIICLCIAFVRRTGRQHIGHRRIHNQLNCF